MKFAMATSRQPARGGFHTPHHACCLLSLRALQHLLLWMLSRTSSPSSTILAVAADPAATEVETVKYALATSGQSARGGLTRLTRALPAELASVAAAGALNVVEVDAVKYALATSRQPARGGFTRLITRAAC